MRDARHRRREAGLLRVLAGGQGQRSHRAAVEAAEEGDDPLPARDVARELQRALDRFGAGLAEEAHAGLAERHDRGQPLRERRHFLVPVVARDVQELRSRILHRLDDTRVRMPGRADRDAGREIEEAVAVHVPGLGAAGVRHHERVVARIGRRGDLAVALDHRARLGSGQLGLNVRVLHGISGAFREGHKGSLTGSRWAAAVRASRARKAASSAAVGAAMVSICGATASFQPMAARASSTGMPG